MPEPVRKEQIEILGTSLRLIACPHILSIEKDRIDVERPVEGTVTDLLRLIAWTRDRLSARVFLDGELVQDAVWEYTVPRAGQSLVVQAIPMGAAAARAGKMPCVSWP